MARARASWDEYFMNVAKEVARSLIPMPVLIGIVVAVAALIVWLVVRH